VRARIIEANNEKVKIIGPVRQGEQQLEAEVLSAGKFRGRVFSSSNHLMGKIELDKIFSAGDTVLAALSIDETGEALWLQVIDHYRTEKTVFLCLLFFACIVIIMGWTGVKIVLSFVFTAVFLVRVLFPAMLRGADPVAATVIVVTALTGVIIFLVGGLTRRGCTAFSGAMAGVLVTSLLAWGFTLWFKIHGAVRPFAEMLLYQGYGHLNLVHLFVSGIFLASSGAMMDLAMDIASAMDEIKLNSPWISRAALVKSGFSVARHVAGTMSTTLLLAYSAEYSAMIMTFLAQGIPLENIINMIYVSAEVVHTLVGCFGLVLVAPLTVLSGGIILGGKKELPRPETAAPGGRGAVQYRCP
jgi:uncharacterized membrane protein